MKLQKNMLSDDLPTVPPTGHPQMPTMVWWWVSAMLCFEPPAGSLSLNCVLSTYF